MNHHTLSRAKLLPIVFLRFLAGLISIGALIFIPAGTLQYWQAWLYICLIFLPMAILGVILLAKDPEMLERRMRMRETQAEQKKAIAAISLVLLAIYLVAGLDKRFGWSAVPVTLVLLADLIILLGYLLFGFTIRENRYASRVIELQQNQVVISSGPYTLVRHPMYLAMTLIFTVTPLALGSYWSLVPGVLFPVFLAARISNEEQMLRRSLAGYDEYTRKVRHRLIPYIW